MVNVRLLQNLLLPMLVSASYSKIVGMQIRIKLHVIPEWIPVISIQPLIMEPQQHYANLTHAKLRHKHPHANPFLHLIYKPTRYVY